jgi:hypothetical protein
MLSFANGVYTKSYKLYAKEKQLRNPCYNYISVPSSTYAFGYYMDFWK